ncbi:amidase [Streptomyces sp. NBC_00075]|uniref:amidase n=1 Tax=Streptomyces sp. NBC_00075 TaxID=2975641 RepID=UPI00324C9E69
MPEDLTWLPAWRLRELAVEKDISPVEVTDHFLNRIEEIDPKLFSFATVDASGAREQAKAAERKVLANEPVGVLHGVPVAVKETIGVKGLPAPAAGIASFPHDYIAVERLRNAGAVILGTTAMTSRADRREQLAGSRSSLGGMPVEFHTDSDVVGTPANPWDLSRDPGPSSRGSGAAVAAGLTPVAIGTDGAGSVRLPAALCGIVGMHVSRGLVPVVDYPWPTLSLLLSTGPLTRSVRDSAIVTQVLAGPDGRDIACSPFAAPDYLEHIDDGIAGLRIGWTDDFGFSRTYMSDETRRVVATAREAAFSLKDLGAAVTGTDTSWDDPLPAYDAMAATFHPFTLIGSLPGPERRPSPAEYQAGAELRGRVWHQTRRFFEEHDLLVSATCTMVAPSPEELAAPWSTEMVYRYTGHTAMFNLLGFPAMSVPCGFVDDLPVGLQIVGRPGDEALVFRAGQAFQQANPRDERPPVG